MSRELRYGLYGGLLTVLWMSLGYYLGWEKSEMGAYAPFVSLIVLTVTIYITVLFKREKDLSGAITFKEAFVAGVSASFVIGLMVGSFLLLYSQYINPGLVNEMMKEAEDYYKGRPDVTQEQIDQAKDSVKAMYSPFGQLTYGIGTTMLVGALISLVCAAIMKKSGNSSS
jgi:hypothetical protein